MNIEYFFHRLQNADLAIMGYSIIDKSSLELDSAKGIVSFSYFLDGDYVQAHINAPYHVTEQGELAVRIVTEDGKFIRFGMISTYTHDNYNNQE